MTQRSAMTLRALRGTPLTDERTRATVVAAAHAIAERHAVPLLRVRTDDDAITVEVGAHRLAALGLVAELRRLTSAWYAHTHEGDSLWGELPPAEDDSQWGADWEPDNES